MLERILQDFNLSNKEISIYKACLDHGPLLASKIAQITKIKRPSTYVVLERLKDKNLITAFYRNNLHFFAAADPEILLMLCQDEISRARIRAERLTKYLSQITLKKKNSTKPTLIRILEGKVGIKVLKNIAKENINGNVISNLWDHAKLLPASLRNELINIKKGERKVIISKKQLPIKTADLRILAKEITNFRGEIRILEKFILIVMIDYQGVIGIIIEDRAITKIFQLIFNLFWENATPPKLLEIIREQGHPPYRVNQIYHAVFKEGKNNFGDIQNIPKDLRDFLQENYPVYSLEEIKTQEDSEVVKVLFDLKDGEKVEAVLMHFTDGRNTICLSSQVGCKLGCHFCATGKMGFKRDLTAEEITDQVLYFKNYYLKEKPITNIVFMGMGEPLLNWDEVYQSIKILNDPEFFNIGARSITVSTSGIVEGIGKLAEIPEQINLAISLHAPNQELREEIMPVAKMHDLKSLMEACDYYVEKKHRRVSYEYIMLRDLNDQDKYAHELAKLLKGKLCHVNLIPWNTTSARSKFQCSTNHRIRTFQRILEAEKITTTVRVSLGKNIDAACGQLAGK